MARTNGPLPGLERVAVWLDRESHVRLRRIAERRAVPFSELVRGLLMFHLAAAEAEPPTEPWMKWGRRK